MPRAATRIRRAFAALTVSALLLPSMTARADEWPAGAARAAPAAQPLCQRFGPAAADADHGVAGAGSGTGIMPSQGQIRHSGENAVTAPPVAGLAVRQPPPAPSAPAMHQNMPMPNVSMADTARGIPGRGIAPPRPRPAAPEDRERYEGEPVAGVHAVADTPVSTFSVDVDTGSYANVRRMLTSGVLPPTAAVRTEEMLNYFRYNYPVPQSANEPFSVHAAAMVTPWDANTRLLRIGLKGYDLDRAETPRANLVFLIDVSGSMNSADKLPLVKAALGMVADKVRPQDRVSIVVYSGAAGLVLGPCNDGAKIRAALDGLQAGGSTAGGAGLALAYATAKSQFDKAGINRILVATDGDFNVGTTNNETLEDMVARQRKDGIALSTLGFGTGNYNEALMERIANVGNGNYAYIDTALEARKVLDQQLSSTLFTIAGDVKIQVEFNPAHVAEYRLIGYENRLLAEEDFADDAVDAGEIGAGHQVTALYEIVPVGAKGWLPARRYEANQRVDGFVGSAAPGREMAHVRLRYKLPGEADSRLIERPLPAAMLTTRAAPDADLRFAAAVAAFGQKLRGDSRLADYRWQEVAGLAADSRDYARAEFVKLVELAGSVGG